MYSYVYYKEKKEVVTWTQCIESLSVIVVHLYSLMWLYNNDYYLFNKTVLQKYS